MTHTAGTIGIVDGVIAPGPASGMLPSDEHEARTAASWWTRFTQRSPLAWSLIGFVLVWRKFVSPLYGDVCKFHPTCSEYGLVSLQTHGAVRGSWLIARRLLRCHPWSSGGFDPVPGSIPLTRSPATDAAAAESSLPREVHP